MRTKTLIILALACVTATLLLGVALVVRADINKLGADSAGVRLAAGATTESGGTARTLATRFSEADEHIRTAFIEEGAVSRVLETMEQMGGKHTSTVTIRSVSKAATGISVSFTIDGSQKDIVATMSEFSTLPVHEITSVYMSYTSSGEKTGWNAAGTLVFPTP